jgi:hypothetical protein
MNCKLYLQNDIDDESSKNTLIFPTEHELALLIAMNVKICIYIAKERKESILHSLHILLLVLLHLEFHILAFL